MPAKLSYEDVKKAFEDKGFKLLSENYESSTSLLKYSCSNGHVHIRTYKYFTKGLPCLDCKKDATKVKKEENALAKTKVSLKGVPKKYSLEFVRNYMSQNGCTLLSDTYTTDRVKLKFLCICGEGPGNFLILFIMQAVGATIVNVYKLE